VEEEKKHKIFPSPLPVSFKKKGKERGSD